MNRPFPETKDCREGYRIAGFASYDGSAFLYARTGWKRRFVRTPPRW